MSCVRFLVVVAAMSCVSCAAAPPPPTRPVREYAGVLRPPTAYPGAFLDEQKVAASFGDHIVTFDAVVQKQGDTLIVLGRTPFGSRAFLLQQKGVQVTFEKYVDRELPFSPRYMLLDVHRVLLRGLSTTGEALPDGDHTGTIDEETVTERWSDGRLRQRRFRAPGGDPPGEILIVYDGGMAPDRTPPKRITLDNGWFGYRLEIVTESHQPL